MACNILNEAASTPAAELRQHIELMAQRAGAKLQQAYRIGSTLAALQQQAVKLLNQTQSQGQPATHMQGVGQT